MKKKWTALTGGAVFLAALIVGVIVQTGRPRHFVIEENTLADPGAPAISASPKTTVLPSPSAAPAQTLEPTASPAAAEKININTATAEELDKLDGVGEKIAQRIIQYREEYGAFEVIEDIMKVSGIGEKKFAAMKDDICVE